MNFKDKIKNYSFWTGLAAAAVMLANAIANAFGVSINSEAVETVVMSVCGVLVAFGVVCIPKKTDINQADKTADNVIFDNTAEDADFDKIVENENKEEKTKKSID